jgi:hypothetical protein
MIACAEKPTAKMTSEEAGWEGEVTGIMTTACSVGKSIQVVVGQTQVACGPGENCSTKTVNQYAPYRIGSMPVPDGMPETYWSATRDHVRALLPPPGLEAVHAAILKTLDAQVALNDTTSKLTGDQRSELLETSAHEACAQYNSFLETAAKRPAPVESTWPAFAVSFHPMGTPMSFGLNSDGQFSVSVSNSIATPFGEVSLAGSKSTASPAAPKRLVIRSQGHERILLMDRDFEVFVPAKYGVRVTNTDTQLILDVDPPMKKRR